MMVEKKWINCKNFDRHAAILIYNNEILDADNHQYALQAALACDKSNYLKLDDNIANFEYVDENIDDIADMTYNLDKEAKIACLDWFDNPIPNEKDYLVFHTLESLKEHLPIALEYAIKNNLTIGCFDDLSEQKFYLI